MHFFRFIHNESQPHEWAVSLTTSRVFNENLPHSEAGGNFFIASYGIRIQAAANTLIAWKPSDWHGTSLFHINPFKRKGMTEFHQRGLCFVTGKRLENAILNAQDLVEDDDAVHDEPNCAAGPEKDLQELAMACRYSKRLQEKKDEFSARLARYNAYFDEYL